MEPLAAAVRSRTLTPPVRASLATLGEIGWPSQASLFKGGRVTTPLCAACGLEDGTQYHRVRRCPATRWMRLSPKGKKAGLHLSGSGAAEAASSPLLRRGVPALDTTILPAPRLKIYAFDAEGNPVAELVPGFPKACTDSSLIDLQPARARRAGWAVVARGPDGLPIGGACGTCPDLVPSAPRAEAWGVLMAIKLSQGPVSIALDCLSVVRTFARGKAFCCCGSRPLANI